MSTQAQTSITSTPATQVLINSPYSFTFTSSGFTASPTYSLSGNLPNGLSLSTAGVISGTPTVTGASTVTVTASDTVGDNPASETFTITVVTTIISNAPATTVGTNQTLNFQYTTGGFTAPPTFTSTGLPAELSLSPTGLLTGTPSTSHIGTTYSVTVTANPTNGVDVAASQSFQLTVATTVLNSVPEGTLTYTVNGSGASNYFSAPFSSDPVYSDAVSTLSSSNGSTTDTINVANASAFTGTLANLEQPASSVPYFVKFLTGYQAGRVLLVKANTATSLTLDITDHTSQSVPLDATGFTVSTGGNIPLSGGGNAPADTFEVFTGETLASLFGSTTQTLILNPGSSAFAADVVGLYNPSLSRFVSYYFNNSTNAGFWEQAGGR